MALVDEGHTDIPATHVYPQMEWNEPTIPAYTPQPQSVTTLWPVLFSVPLRVEG